jgi:hypothetical protein
MGDGGADGFDGFPVLGLLRVEQSGGLKGGAVTGVPGPRLDELDALHHFAESLVRIDTGNGSAVQG